MTPRILVLAIALAAAPVFAPVQAQDGPSLRMPPEQDAPQSGPAGPTLEAVLEGAAALTPLKAVVVSRDGQVVAERGYRGNSVTAPTNIKSASKSVISALVGIAIDKGYLDGPDQTIAPILADDLPENPDPRLMTVTIGNLLSMQAGLERTSGQNYGAWVTSRNWVRYALSREFVSEPGGRMLYSTGSTHLLSAILTRATGQSTRELAEEWLGPLPGFAVGGWERDPQGVYMGGNQMAMSARSLIAFGELYRTGGLAPDGTRLLSAEWVDASWTPRTRSIFSGEQYGYNWFLGRIAGEDVRYGWGYGGQMIYVVPRLGLTVAMTSDDSAPSGRSGYRDDLHGLLAGIIGAARGRYVYAPAAAGGAE